MLRQQISEEVYSALVRALLHSRDCRSSLQGNAGHPHVLNIPLGSERNSWTGLRGMGEPPWVVVLLVCLSYSVVVPYNTPDILA